MHGPASNDPQASPGDPDISPLALVASNAELGAGVRVGPFAVIGREGAEPVRIGSGTVIEDHVLVEPGATIGTDCLVEDHCRIGRGSTIAAGSVVRSGIAPSEQTGKRHAAAAATSRRPASPSISPQALVASNVTLGDGAVVEPFAIVGWEGEPPVVIGPGTRIAPFALVEPGAIVGEDCLIDAYCRIAEGARIGNRTQVLYGAAVFESAQIGEACIVGGNVADRTVIEDCVTHFGEIAHDYRDPGDLKDWDERVTPSPTIKACSVVGQYAVIIGGRTIGPKSYVAAGEVVRVDVPEGMLFQKGKMAPIAKLKGMVKVRSDGICA